MKLKSKKLLIVFFLTVNTALLSNTTFGQTKLEKFNQKVSETGNKVNNVIQKFFNPKKRNTSETNSTDLNNQSKSINLKSINLNGKWKGTCQRTPSYDYDFLLDLVEVNNVLSGTAELRTSHHAIKYSVSGKVEKTTFTLFQDAVIEVTGTRKSDKLDFTGQITQEDGILVIKGQAVNTNKLVFYDNEIKASDIGSTNKIFSISKVNEVEEAKLIQKQCISGNCKDGYGTKETYLGKYEGNFKDYKMEGKGTFDCFYGPRKGNRYIGEFKNDAFYGYGILYEVIDKETSKNPSYKKQITGIESENGEILYPLYEGSWYHNYPSGLGKRYRGGLPQIGIWKGWYLSDTKALEFPILNFHLDTTFKIFQKCNCLSPSKIKINASGLGSVLYDVFDGESGKFVRQKSEIEIVDKSYFTDGFINKTNMIIYIKGYRKVHNVHNDQDEYIDESFAVLPNEETLLNYRSLPQAGDFIEIKAKENFIFLGQYCLKNVQPCKPVKK